MTGIHFPVGVGIFLFATACRLGLGTTQPPIQWLLGSLSLQVKQG